jgi:hypothetical protein
MTVLIGGDSYRVTNRYTIQQQAGSIAISNIDVEALAGAHVPQSLEDVQILLDDVPFFYGQINSVDTPDFSSGFETRKYRLTVQSAEIIFKNRLVSESLKDVYAHDIIQVMFDNYIASEGITLGDISTTETFYKSYTASYLKLETILKEMMEDAGATCYISPDKKFYFQVQADLEQIPAPPHITKATQGRKRQRHQDSTNRSRCIRGNKRTVSGYNMGEWSSRIYGKLPDSRCDRNDNKRHTCRSWDSWTR